MWSERDGGSDIRRQHSANRSERKGSTDPGEFLDAPEPIDDGSLDVGGDGGVQAIDQSSEVQREADNDPSEARDRPGRLFWDLIVSHLLGHRSRGAGTRVIHR